MEPVTRRIVALAATLAVALVPAGAAAAQAPPADFGDGLCAIEESACGPPPMLAVFSAFPAELESVLTHATVHETLVVGDRVLRVGTMGGVPVVLGLLGIGLGNAGATTRLVLDRFDVAAVVVSGVAGSAPYHIGDVTVPATWLENDGTAHAADPSLLEVASAIAPNVLLERCGAVPPDPPGPIVCLPNQPAVIVGGTGESDDPFGGRPDPCTPGTDPVFGCDVATGVTAAAGSGPVASQAGEPLAANDMETAAVAREAGARGVPFVAFRAVSDNEDFRVFFDYYRIAADNAAAVAAAFVERWGAGRAPAAPAAASPTIGASCSWPRRATATCATGEPAPRALTAVVDRCCRLLASPNVNDKKVARAWRRAAHLAKQAAARRRLGRECAGELSTALRRRAGS